MGELFRLQIIKQEAQHEKAKNKVAEKEKKECTLASYNEIKKKGTQLDEEEKNYKRTPK